MSEPRTKYVVKRKSDGWYLTRFGWSDDRAHAWRFPFMTIAVMEAEQKNLGDTIDIEQVEG